METRRRGEGTGNQPQHGAALGFAFQPDEAGQGDGEEIGEGMSIEQELLLLKEKMIVSIIWAIGYTGVSIMLAVHLWRTRKRK